jgi:hypothetical protein
MFVHRPDPSASRFHEKPPEGELRGRMVTNMVADVSAHAPNSDNYEKRVHLRFLVLLTSINIWSRASTDQGKVSLSGAKLSESFTSGGYIGP